MLGFCNYIFKTLVIEEMEKKYKMEKIPIQVIPLEEYGIIFLGLSLVAM
jgi:hypothetical protein